MKRILVAIDASEAADAVIARAVELAKSIGAKIQLLHVVPREAEPLSASLFEGAADTNALIAAAESELLIRQKYVPEEHRDGVVVALGRPWEAICEHAMSYKAAIVVIGAHRYGVVERALGTTAAKVVNHIDRPVLVVRPAPSAARVRIGPRAVAKARESSRPHEGHVFLEAATLAGAASGAVTGALAGPPGAIVGGAIGTAIGMLAGGTLDEVIEKDDAHDRELDDAIGVTEGDLGAREMAVRGLNASDEALVTDAQEPSAATDRPISRFEADRARLRTLVSSYR